MAPPVNLNRLMSWVEQPHQNLVTLRTNHCSGDTGCVAFPRSLLNNQVPPCTGWDRRAITSTSLFGGILIVEMAHTLVLLVGGVLASTSERVQLRLSRRSCLFLTSIVAWCFLRKSGPRIPSVVRGLTTSA